MFNTDLITENRKASALKKEMTPLRLSKEDRVAVFAGSEGRVYETSLDQCNCPDFAIQGSEQPCKHMLRLAMELDEIPAEGMQTDIEAARGKYFLGKAKEFIKYSDTCDFVKFAIAFSRLAFYGKTVEDNAFAESMKAESVLELPFFKFKKNGVPSVKKEWAKECNNLLNTITTRLGKVTMDRADESEEFLNFLLKENDDV